MKQEPTVSDKTSFRYLKERDINNPHFQIVCFFCDENNIESFRFGMIDLVKTACSNGYYGNKDSYYYHKPCIGAIQLKEMTGNNILLYPHVLIKLFK